MTDGLERPALRLRERRDRAGMTQADLARRAGVSRALVSAVEAGRHLPRTDAALALARALGTTVETLFGSAGAPLVDAITGDPPEPGRPVRVGYVGERPVAASLRHDDAGWDAADAVTGADADTLVRAGAEPGVVMAGCEPALVLLERLLRDAGTRAIAIASTSAAARAALGARRLHAAAVHFPTSESPPDTASPVVRLRLARWRVGLAAPRGSAARWWQRALSGRVEVIQREPGAAAQAAFERALRGQRGQRAKARPVAGPRVASHLAASRRAVDSGLPAVTMEPAAAAAGAAFHALETHDVELWIAAEHAATPPVERLLGLLHGAPCRRTLECVGGYDLSEAGSIVA